MKNLLRVGERRRKLVVDSSWAEGANDSVVDLCTFTDHVDVGTSTMVLTEKGTLTRINDAGDVVWVRHLRDLDDSCRQGGWFNLAHIDPELVCLSRNGAMVTVNPTTGEAEIVGVFDYGLEAASWSPDGEVLLMVTSASDDDDGTKSKSVVMTMNAQFEVMAEINIPAYLGSLTAENMSVSVAWRPDGTLCAVSAVDADDTIRKVRVYKRETLELHAIGRSEDGSGTLVQNLQDSGISWAGSGCSQLLAAVQRKGKKTQQVVFFEANGLRHREFALREAPTTIVTSMTWNASSDLLALLLKEADGTNKVQLWHRCNYHWYMKQEIRYSKLAIQALKFNEEHADEFYVLLKGMEWREYRVRWETSTTIAIHDDFPAFVVDGCSLNVTLLNKGLIPPPMFLRSFVVNFPITDISFCRGAPYEGFALVQVSSGDLLLLSKNRGSATFDIRTVVLTNSEIDWKSLRSFIVVHTASDEIGVVAIAPGVPNGSSETLIEIVIRLDCSEPIAQVVDTSLLEDRVLRIVNWSDDGEGCLIELIDGSLLEYDVSGGSSSLQPSSAGPFLEPCPWVCAIKDPTPYVGSHGEAHSRMVFGLSAHARLYYHDIMLNDSASSFYLSMNHEFLSYATNGSRCYTRFLPFREITSFDPLMGLDQNHLLEGYEPRVVEGGARIVAILPSQPMAILQVPRGNLEGIYPRALVLRFVMLKIHQGQYDEAFMMMRTHKVDVNVLVDFDPWEFYERGIAAFFAQVKTIDHLNLFLSGLQDFDVTLSRFPVPSWLRQESKEGKDRSSFDFSTKVNQVCRKARSTMLYMEQAGAKPEGHFLLPVLSTFAKESPHKLDEALAMIKDRALEHHAPNSKKLPLFADKAQNAIHYLAFLAEYELLFETALGMYDFDIARAVARNSQMDPKVYLPLLKRLKGLPCNYVKYEIDMRLKRYDSALKNLFESSKVEESLDGFGPEGKEDIRFGNSFDDCLALIEKQKLHRLALQLYHDDSAKVRVILISLGNSLMADNKADSALCAFLAALPPAVQEAKHAARAARDWRTFFALLEPCAIEVNDENVIEQRRQVARDVAREIVSKGTEVFSMSKQKLHLDAARILLDYGDDLIGALDLLVNAQCWDEAHRIASSYRRSDLLNKCIDGATQFAHDSMDNFVEMLDNFESTAKRYSEILLLRKKNASEEGLVADDADETGSLFSAASNISNMSLQSGASTSSTGSATSSIISVKTATTFSMTNSDNVHRHRSKFNKGKAKTKKKQKIRRKPGSQEELTSLVFALKGSCPNLEYAGILSETICYLLRVQQVTIASEVYKHYNTMRESIAKIQSERMETARLDKVEAEKRSRGTRDDGPDDAHVLVELPEEKEVDGLRCAPLESSLVEFFGYLSA